MSLFDTAWYINFGDGATTGYYAVTPWSSGASVAAGVFRRQLATPAVGSERIFVSLTAGTTGGSEPSWTLTRGAKTTDNTVTWQECTGMAGANGDLTNAPTWTTVKNTAVSLGEVIYDSGSGSMQICSTAGTAGNGSTPSFSATAGTTTADNTITWTSLGASSSFTGWQYPHARLSNAFASGWGVAGNTFYVASAHAETSASTITNTSPGTISAPCTIICATTAAAPPTTTATSASITSSAGNINNNGYAYCYGVQFVTTNTGQSIAWVDSTNSNWIYDTCVLNGAHQAFGSSAGLVVLNNCTILFNSTSQIIQAQSLQPTIIFRGCTFASSGSVPNPLFKAAAGMMNLTLIDCDLSAITGTLFGSFGGGSNAVLENCKLNSGVIIASGFAGGLGQSVRVHNCDSGATNYKVTTANPLGTQSTTTSVVRTGGAVSGSTQVAWQLVSTANASFGIPFSTQVPFGEEMAIWNTFTSGSHTATIFLTTAATLHNNEVWAEVECLGNSGNPQGTLSNSRMALLGTPTALTTDGVSSWTGGLGNNYKVAVTFSPAMIGPLKVRLYVAKPSTTIVVDPFIVLA